MNLPCIIGIIGLISGLAVFFTLGRALKHAKREALCRHASRHANRKAS